MLGQSVLDVTLMGGFLRLPWKEDCGEGYFIKMSVLNLGLQSFPFKEILYKRQEFYLDV